MYNYLFNTTFSKKIIAMYSLIILLSIKDHQVSLTKRTSSLIIPRTMVEQPHFYDTKEKIQPGYTLLFAEPIFRAPSGNEGKKTEFNVPLGTEESLAFLGERLPSAQAIADTLAEEYFSIGSALKELQVPFRIIIAHRKHLDERVVFTLLTHLGVRGLGLSESISSTAFPRDMLTDFDGQMHINPEANFRFPDGSGMQSTLGEGGRVLRLGRKVLLPDTRVFPQPKKYLSDVAKLPAKFQVGFLPPGLSVSVNVQTGTVKDFTNDHLDRVAPLLKGKDQQDYLLLDKNYADGSHPLYGSYWPLIKESCQKQGVTPVVVDRPRGSIPYALNLEQFYDGTVLLTGGDPVVQKIVEQIVGKEKTHTTSRPIIYYPLYRQGGIRCMLLHAPQKMVSGT
jgi:hypothetical protein